MKKSSDWVRQPALDEKLDQLVDERCCAPAELIPYDAAKALGIEPSGEFYKKVRDWKQRRAAEHGMPMIEVPPHVQAEFRETVDRFAAEVMADFLCAVRSVSGDLDRVASLRVTDAERRADEAHAEVNGLLDHWTAAEAQRDAAQAKIVELEMALADSLRREGVAAVRLEERDALLKALRPGSSNNNSAVIVPLVSATDGVSLDDDRDDPVGEVAIDADAAWEGQPVADIDSGVPEQPSIIDDRPKDGQAVMSLVTSDDADQADVDSTDRG